LWRKKRGMSDQKNPFLLNVRGHKCPIPVLRLRRCLEERAVGDYVKVIASDAMTMVDVPHFCFEAGHELCEKYQDQDDYIFLIQKCGPKE